MIKINLSIKNKSHGRDTVTVLNNFDLEVIPGEFVAIVGPSGAGKSTMLNMVAGLESSEVGEIRYNDRAMPDLSKIKIGYIFQEPRLMPWLTVKDNIKLVSPHLNNKEIKVLLEDVGLSEKESFYPRQLSGGMQRRVSIARAFSNSPELLLLDEPFVSLDRPNAQRLRGVLESLLEIKKPTVLFVTHDLSEAIRLADRIVFMSSAPGRVIHDVKVDLPKPRKDRGAIESMWESRFLSENEGVLEGKISSAPSKSLAGGAE